MSKTPATLFTEFEKDLLKNMQELEILKSQKEYVLKNINIPFRKWLYSGKTESAKDCSPFVMLNTEVGGNCVLFPKLHLNINKMQNTFASKYNLYEISTDNHPMVDDSIKLLKTLSKRIPCSKNNTLLGQTKATLTDEMFFEDSSYLDYLTNLMLTLGLIERHVKKTSKYDSIKISEKGKEYLTLSKSNKFKLLRIAAVSYASYQLKANLISKADMLATLLERNHEKVNTSIKLDFFAEEKLNSLLTSKNVDLEKYYDEIFNCIGIDRMKYVKYFNSKSAQLSSLEDAYEDDRLFLAIYIMDIQNTFDTYFVTPFSYYFMNFIPKYSAEFNCQSTIMEMLLEKDNKRMCEHLSYSVPISLTSTQINN